MSAAQINASDAAFSVVSLTRQNVPFVLKFVAITAVTGWIGSVVSEMALGDYMRELANFTEADAQNPAVVLERLSGTLDGPMLGLSMLVSLVLGAITNAMALRKTVLNLELPGPGIAFGSLEMRLLGASVLISVGSALSAGVILGLSGLGGPIGVAVALGLVAGGALMLIGRLGLWGVLATEGQSLGLKESWAATPRVGWHLVGAFALWLAAAALVVMFGGLVISVITGTGAAMQQAMADNRLFSLMPQGVIAGLLNGALYGYLGFSLICVGSYAWHQMKANAPLTSVRG
jgi:hypothetical protein